MKEKSTDQERMHKIRQINRALIRRAFEKVDFASKKLETGVSVHFTFMNAEGNASEAYFVCAVNEVKYGSMKKVDGSIMINGLRGCIAYRNFVFVFPRIHDSEPVHVAFSSGTYLGYEGLGFGSGLLFVNDDMVRKVLRLYKHYVCGRNAVATITDRATPNDRNKKRDGWTSDHARAMGYQESKMEPGKKPTFQKVFPASL